ncbi:putative leader peptide [Streptomyces sp. NBC_01216]|uniref:putative leader peptide n=1 Tax=unclassified Streptomyces TaxID=2593676 RepID=UPI002E0E7BE5
MVPHDVSEQTPGTRLPASVADAPSASAFLGVFGGGAARLHVDLCRLAGAICTSRAAL